jgi:hypothetical protein
MNFGGIDVEQPDFDTIEPDRTSILLLLIEANEYERFHTGLKTGIPVRVLDLANQRDDARSAIVLPR